MHRSQRRSTKVCTRCRQRKTKCDFIFPACTACKQAKAECLGFDPVSRRSVPRSLVKSLEAQVAELEAELASLQAAPYDIISVTTSKVAQVTLLFGIPRATTFLSAGLSPSLIFRPSCPPLAVVGKHSDQPAQRHLASAEERGSVRIGKDDRPTHSLGNQKIPFSAIKRMMTHYVEHHLPQYPCVGEDLLKRVVEQSLGQDFAEVNPSLSCGNLPSDPNIGHFEYFAFFIALAISANTLTWKAEEQARAASEWFFKSALKHLQALEGNSDIEGLQIFLLLAHYAHMCPQRIDNWTCIANAVRIVLDLGLYRFCPEGLDAEDVRRRSELFWVTYGMERSLCANLRLSLSFPEEIITAQFEPPQREEVESLFTTEDFAKKSSAYHLCRYRVLETEVHRVLHLQEDLITGCYSTIEQWIESITDRLETWYQEALLFTQHSLLEFKHVQFCHLKVRIYRPTPRLRSRTFEDRRIVLESCLALMKDYLGQYSHRRLFYPWHGVHILFEVVLLSLEACWSSRNFQPLQGQTVKLLNEWIPCCLQLLENIGREWNEAIVCAGKLRPLAQKIASSLNSTDTAEVLNEDLIANEIEELLFPDGSLAWNHTPQGDISFDTDDGSWFLDQEWLNDPHTFPLFPDWETTIL